MRTVAVGILLAIGTATVLGSVIGVLAAREPLDRLHYSGPASSVAAVLLGAAVLLDGPPARVIGEVVLVVVALVLTGPLVAHVLARAFHVRRAGGWEIPGLDGDEEEAL